MNKTVFSFIRNLLVLGLITSSAIQLSAQAIDTIFVSDKYSVHVAFSHELRYVDVSNEDSIQANIVDNYSSILSLKCSEKFQSNCSLTVLLSTGEIESFILKFKQEDIDFLIDRRDASSIVNSPSLSDIMKMDKQFYHIGTKKDGVLVLCDVIKHYEDMIMLRLELTNNSSSDFLFEQASFVAEKKSSSGKRSVESSFQPSRIDSVGSLTARQGETSRMVFCFDSFRLKRNE